MRVLFDQYLQEVGLAPDAPRRGYPWNLPVVRAIRREPLRFHPQVTYLVGENGTGKSTLLEAIATSLGFNAEGGTRNLRFSTRDTHSDLGEYLRVGKGVRARRGFFFRAESFYNVATAIDVVDNEIEVARDYGGRSLHAQSHGESFLALASAQFGDHGVYLLDEPEAALSPGRQLTILSILHESVQAGSQYVIATHAPILMAYPNAWMYQLSESGLERVAYDDTESVQLTRNFLANPARMLKHLFDSD